ncbi:heme peroxidase family protein [Paraburkholderia strydomiana]|uniref:peroxidase family protein n=1 Tax=Paraburkholderia strydomiana TaxID=1245417 RepID=UPI0038BD87F7
MSADQGQVLGRRDAMGHGGGVRGADTAGRSVQFEGRFGRMFRALPAARFLPKDLQRLAAVGHMMADAETKTINGKTTRIATAEGELDDEENFGIPAGYTYFGQFVDHDLTFDPVSSLQGQNDPDALTDFRTPRFDLDSMYGRGPTDQPYMYDADGRTFLLGRHLTGDGPGPSFDLPRTPQGRAIIGDKRNDENVIVSQLHGMFLRFHNSLADRFTRLTFAEIQQSVRWHYQWVVLHDFLPRIVGQDMVHTILPHLRSHRSIFDDPPQMHFYNPRQEAFIPVEFSVAAYRFGHSMVRPIYRLNEALGQDTDDETHTAGRLLIFASEGKAGLNGFREFPSQWAINWRLFFEFGNEKLSPDNTRTKKSQRVQPSYKIDTSLVNPLDFLPEFCVINPKTQNFELAKDGKPRVIENVITGMPEVPSLALRNLLRGSAMGLPSGQAVARAMGIEPMADESIRIGKATIGNTFANGGEDTVNPSIADLGESFRGNAPLWVYVLAEAQAQWTLAAEQARKTDPADEEAANALPVRLGPVGGRIVAETIIGLLLADSHSFLAQAPAWVPDFGASGKFELPELLDQAMSWNPRPVAAGVEAIPPAVCSPENGH